MNQAVRKERLGDLFTFKNGRAFKKQEWSTKGLPIIRIQNLNNENASFNYFSGEYSKDIVVESGDLLFSWSGTVGSSFGSHLWSRDTGVLNQHIFKVGLSGEIGKRYALHALRYITEAIEEQVSGAVGLVHITKEKLNEFTIPVPTISEQQRIVGILDDAFAGIDTAKANAEKNLHNARSVFDSHLKFIFDQRGDGWVEKRLGVLYQIGSSKRVLKSQWKKEGVPFYRGREVTRLAGEGFVDNELFLSEEHFAELSKQAGVPKAGDIVITAIGTIGNAHVVRESDRFYFKDASVLWMRRVAEVSSEFIKLWLKTALFFDQLDRGNGATVDTLTIQKLQGVALRLPSLNEQKIIVAKLNAICGETQSLESLYQRKLAAINALKQSLLHQAFSGQL